jgi:hypothetical protein
MDLRQEGLLGIAADYAQRHQLVVSTDARQAFVQGAAFQMRCGCTLKELSEAAGRAGIELLTFKGCALAFGCYPRAGLRAFGDIDLAVRPEQVKGAREVLVGAGFQQDPSGWTFTREGLIVDLHQHPLHQVEALIGPRAASWWDSLVPLSAQTGDTRRLPHELEFVLALVHACKHSVSRACWVVDAALLASRVESERLAEAVLRYKVGYQLSLVDHCLNSWFSLSLPPELAGLASRPGNFFDRRFFQLVEQRRARDSLGMLTPVRCAHNWKSGLTYLRYALYPAGVPFWTRTGQLAGMLGSLAGWRL